MSYGRMRDEERRLREQIAALTTEAEATDAAEDAEHGPDVRGDELPAELQRRERGSRPSRRRKRGSKPGRR